MERSLFNKYEKPREDDGLQTRKTSEQFINEIVEQMYAYGRPLTTTEKKETAKRFAIAANTLGLSNKDLHYLSKPSNFPSVKNYSAFVNSRFTVKNKDTHQE